MFSFFKKNTEPKEDKKNDSFEIELTASVLAYEIARIDGNISANELSVLMEQVKLISNKTNKSEEEIMNIIETYSKNSVSFYEFVEDINKQYTKDEKLSLLGFMWKIAFADGILEVDEERLIKRLAEMINIKNLDVLKLKNKTKI